MADTTIVPRAGVFTAGAGLTITGTQIDIADAELVALMGLTSAANKLPYFTGSGTAALADLSAAGRALIDDADASAQRATLGLVIGTNVQGQDAELQAIAGLTSAADKLPYFTGSGTAALADLTTAGRALIDDADATAQRTTLGLGTMATQNASAVAITGGTITGLSDPSGSSDAANKNYVDTVAQGLDVKASVKAATTSSITLSASSTIDGVLCGNGTRVLVKNQASPAENGIYVVSSAGAWSRAQDMDAWAEVPGAFVFVEEGTTNADCGFVCTADTGGTLGTTAITWSQFSGAGTYSAGTGLTLTGTQFAISDAELLAIAGLTSAADRLPYFTGSGTAALATFTAAGRALVDDADAATQRTTLGVGTSDSPSFNGVTVSGQTASRLVAFNGSKAAVSTAWQLLTSDRISFGGSVLSSLGRQFVLEDNTPGMGWYEADAGTNEKAWDMSFAAGVWTWRTVNDAVSAATTFITVRRSGTTLTGFMISAPFIVGPTTTNLPSGTVTAVMVLADNAADPTAGASTIPIWNNAGRLSYKNHSAPVARAMGVIYQTVTAVGNVGTGEDDLISQSIAANTLQTNGDRIRITWEVKFAANANNKTLKTYWNGVAIYNSTALALNGGGCTVQMVISRTGATTQNVRVNVISGNLTLPTTCVQSTGAATLSGAVTTKLTGEATSDNDIQATDMVIELLPAA